MAEGVEGSTQTQQSSEEPLGMRAVLIGTTGAVGECLLGELLSSKVCFSRSVVIPNICKLFCTYTLSVAIGRLFNFTVLYMFICFSMS